MLNFTTAWSMATKKSTFGYDGDSNYIMDDVGCKGTERKLDYCPNKYYHDCKVGEAAGVICFGNIFLLGNLIADFQIIDLENEPLLILAGGKDNKSGDILYRRKPIW